MLGNVSEVDMASFRADKVIRLKLGVLDPSKIPQDSALTPFVYHIRFELEQIVERGGPIIDGRVIILEEDATSPSNKFKPTKKTMERYRGGGDGPVIRVGSQCHHLATT
jgi:hypothetical protein